MLRTQRQMGLSLSLDQPCNTMYMVFKSGVSTVIFEDEGNCYGMMRFGIESHSISSPLLAVYDSPGLVRKLIDASENADLFLGHTEPFESLAPQFRNRVATGIARAKDFITVRFSTDLTVSLKQQGPNWYELSFFADNEPVQKRCGEADKVGALIRDYLVERYGVDAVEAELRN